jgi:heavy metal translocating P-type ATPase
MDNAAQPVHETPDRLRFRERFLGDPLVDFSWLETWLEQIRGVESLRINRRARSVVLHYDGSSETRSRICTAIAGLRRRRLPVGESEPSAGADLGPVLTTAALIVASPFLPVWALRALTFVNLFRTVAKGGDTLINRGVKIEVLDAIAVGLTAARGEYVTANITEFLMQLGAYLETRTERQSNRMLRRLIRPEPVMAWVEREGRLIQIPDDEIRAGERVETGVGERIAVDGLVIDGTALVNQSSITGEPMPVRKEVMDRVIAGSVVEDGRLRIEARHVGDDTTTARIARFIDESLERSSPTQRMAERLADQRVLLTLGTGGLIYLLTGDQRRLSSVFLVDYSCALKLGTPLAFKSGMYHAAAAGILLKGGEAIERLAEIDTVVFDKTGTLTNSSLEVSDVVVLDEARWPRDRLLAMTASIEEHASHPVAEAVVRKARQERLNHVDHGEVEYLVAHGMSCPMGGDRLLIGSRHFLEDHEGLSFTAFEARIEALQGEGKTILYIGTPNEPIGLIALSDSVRAETPAVLAALRDMGVRHLAMLTGDSAVRAEALAGELGLDEVFSEQAPEDKAGIIEQLRAEGRRVAFIGDGVNDGPALIAADVGVAMARGADLARATADAMLLEDRLDLLVEAVETSRRTMGLVASNYRAAIGINTGVMLGAALGALSPVTTAVLHNGTTVGLLLRALRGLSGPSRRV